MLQLAATDLGGRGAFIGQAIVARSTIAQPRQAPNQILACGSVLLQAAKHGSPRSRPAERVAFQLLPLLHGTL